MMWTRSPTLAEEADGAPASDQRAVVWAGRLFGDFALLDPNGADCTPSSRKSRALLAYLLVTGKPVRREQLAALLWGDRGDEQARASLRQSLYEMRSLGEGSSPLLVTDRTQVSVLSDRIESDLELLSREPGSLFRELIADLLSRPRFLADLDDVDFGFDQWLAQERARRERQLHAFALKAARHALGEGDDTSARSIADALFACAPIDRDAADLAMEVSARAGDVAAVRSINGRYVEALREDLGLSPTDEEAARADAMLVLAAEGRAGRSRLPLRVRTSPAKSAPQVIIVALIAVVVVLASALAWFAARPAANVRILLVTRLEVPAGDLPAATVADGLSSVLAGMLVGVDRRVTILDVADVGRRSADYLVAGSAHSQGGVLHASLRLLDPATRSILWSHDFDRAAVEADALRDQMMARLGDVVSCGIAGRNPSLAELGLEAMRLYLKSCEEKHGDWAEAAKLDRQVVAFRPGFAHAWAMLADGIAANATELPPEGATAQFSTAERLARHAIALDPHDAEPYSALVDARPGIGRWNERNALLRRAIAIEPENDVVTEDMAEELMAVGRVTEGDVFAERAVEFDPFNQWAVMSLIADYGLHDQRDRVPALLALAARRWPGNPDLASMIFSYQMRAGDPAEALRMLDDPQRAFYLEPRRIPVRRAIIEARLGRQVPETIRLLKRDLVAAISPDGMLFDADAFAVLGRPDLAWDALDRIKGNVSDPSRLFDDYWAPVRANPRFMTFAARQGLVELWRKTQVWPDFCVGKSRPYDCAAVADELGRSRVRVALRE